MQDSYNSSLGIYNIFKRYLNISKDCATFDGTCFASKTEYKNMLGNESYLGNYSYDSYAGGMLHDGTTITVHSHTNEKCNAGEYCFLIYIDINGAKKPNRMGVDLFQFTAFKGSNGKSSSLSPNCSKTRCSIITNNLYTGQGCACWVINNGNMDYRRRNVSNEWN